MVPEAGAVGGSRKGWRMVDYLVLIHIFDESKKFL